MADLKFQFTYELETGRLAEWSCSALNISEARALARLHCPDALDCAVEPVHVVEEIPIGED